MISVHREAVTGHRVNSNPKSKIAINFVSGTGKEKGFII